MHTGWFKFHRQIFDNPICTKDSEYFFVWCYLLNEAGYEEKKVLFKNEEIILEKGQLLITVKSISDELKIDESKVNRILKKLESEKQIERQTSNKSTVVTIVNWQRYQSDEKQNDKQITNKCQTSEEQMTNNQKTNEELSYYTKKERNKEDKNSKNIAPKESYYPDDELLDEAFNEYVTMRKKIKKPICTDKALHRAMNTLGKLSGGDNDLAVKILNQSVDHCWQGLFELKEDNSNKQGNQNFSKGAIDWDNV